MQLKYLLEQSNIFPFIRLYLSLCCWRFLDSYNLRLALFFLDESLLEGEVPDVREQQSKEYGFSDKETCETSPNEPEDPFVDDVVDSLRVVGSAETVVKPTDQGSCFSPKNDNDNSSHILSF